MKQNRLRDVLFARNCLAILNVFEYVNARREIFWENLAARYIEPKVRTSPSLKLSVKDAGRGMTFRAPSFA
jgi:hypothetical protein